jgi:hypothetical protein
MANNPLAPITVPDQQRMPLVQESRLWERVWFEWFLKMWTAVKGSVMADGDLTLNKLVVGAGTNTIKVQTLLDGELPIGAADGTVQPSTLTAGTGIAITNGAHSITIRATGFGSLIPLVTGAEPPVLVSDGDGHLILVPAA